MNTVLNIISLLIGVAYLGFFARGLFIKVQPQSKKDFYKLSSLFIVPLLVISLLRMLFFGLHFDSLIALAPLVMAMIVGIMFLQFLFGLLENRYHQHWLKVIHGIGIFFVIVTCMFFSEFHYSSIVDQILFSTSSILILITISTFPFALLAWLIERSRLSASYQPTIKFPKGKSDRLQYYREQGLSERDIIFFREEMAQAKLNIETIEKEMSEVAKLRVIETRYNTIDVSKQFFKDIVKEPHRLAQAGVFLNKLLPSLVDLTKKYTEISQHVAKNKQTYLILERSAQTIEKVCESISEQYLAFHQSLFDDLDDEIKLANKTLDSAVEHEETESKNTVDELINEAFQVEEDV